MHSPRFSSAARALILGNLRLPAIVGVAALALAGCGVEKDKYVDEGVDDDLGTAQSEQTICPKDKTKTVLGIDVSVYQGDIDWNAVKGAGVKFAIARKSDGTYLDTKFDKNWPAIKAAGLIRGVYQFFEPDGDVAQQANIVIDAVGKLGNNDLPAMIDVEKAGNVSKAQYTAEIKQWLDLVEAGTGKRPMIYTGKYFWQDNVGSSAFNDSPLVHAAYPNACYPSSGHPPLDCWMGSCPNLADQFDSWEFWQFTSKGSIAGISGNVDVDIFNGDMAALQLISGGGYAGKLVSVDVPTTVVAGETIMAHVTFKNTGGPSWDGNTKLGTTDPRDRMSAFADASWEGPNRAAHVNGTVKPGDTYTFDFPMVAPTKTGNYTETFSLVQEAVTWFADEGGPDDKAVVMDFQVVDKPSGTVTAAVSTSSSSTSSATTSTGSGSGGAGGAPNTVLSRSTCNCELADPTDHDLARGVVALGAVALVFARRKRASRAA